MNIFPILFLVLGNIVIRKEIRDMSKEEWKEYKEAFNLFKDKGYLADISKIHVDVDSYAHKNGRFLPWHRMLLLHVESILQMLTRNPNLSIPYWDWSVDSEEPGKSFIFKDKYWGISECYSVDFPTPHCLERNKEIDPLYNIKDVKRLINGKGSYNEFRDIIELVPHALVHSNLGGDMTQMYSPNDPVFWHHHSFIDYIWHERQKKGLKNEYGGVIENKKLDVEERLYPFNRQVKDVLDLKDCKIKYKPFEYVKSMSENINGMSENINGMSENINGMHEHKKPSELPLFYIKHHKYDEEIVRKYEKFMRGETKKGTFRKIWEWFTGNHTMA